MNLKLSVPCNFFLTFLPLCIFNPIANNSTVFPKTVLKSSSFPMLVISKFIWIRDFLFWGLKSDVV